MGLGHRRPPAPAPREAGLLRRINHTIHAIAGGLRRDAAADNARTGDSGQHRRLDYAWTAGPCDILNFAVPRGGRKRKIEEKTTEI